MTLTPEQLAEARRELARKAGSVSTERKRAALIANRTNAGTCRWSYEQTEDGLFMVGRAPEGWLESCSIKNDSKEERRRAILTLSARFRTKRKNSKIILNAN